MFKKVIIDGKEYSYNKITYYYYILNYLEKQIDSHWIECDMLAMYSAFYEEYKSYMLSLDEDVSGDVLTPEGALYQIEKLIKFERCGEELKVTIDGEEYSYNKTQYYKYLLSEYGNKTWYKSCIIYAVCYAILYEEYCSYIKSINEEIDNSIPTPLAYELRRRIEFKDFVRCDCYKLSTDWHIVEDRLKITIGDREHFYYKSDYYETVLLEFSDVIDTNWLEEGYVAVYAALYNEYENHRLSIGKDTCNYIYTPSQILSRVKELIALELKKKVEEQIAKWPNYQERIYLGKLDKDVDIN